MFWVCNGKNDCPQGSDESQCKCDQFGLVEWKTREKNSACIPQNWRPSKSSTSATLWHTVNCHCDTQTLALFFTDINSMSLEERRDSAWSGQDAEQSVNYFMSCGSDSCDLLSHMITTALQANTNCLDTIYLLGNYSTDTSEEVYWKEEATSQRIFVVCQTSCVVKLNLSVVTTSLWEHLSIVFENITIEDSSVILQNVKIFFVNVTLTHVLLSSTPPRPGEFGHITIGFSDVLMHNCNLEFSQTSGIYLSVDHTTTKNTSVVVSALSLILEVESSLLQFTHFSCSANVIVGIFQRNLHSNCTETPLQLYGNKLYLYANWITIQHSAGGFSVTKRDSGVLESWLEAYIENSQFRNNSKFGSGGAVMFSYFLSSYSQLSNAIEIKNSSFSHNAARSTSSISKGGALAILYPISPKSCGILDILVSDSTFSDNIAGEGGGAIYQSTGCMHLTLLSSHFVFQDERVRQSNGLFVTSHSEISIENCQFTIMNSTQSAFLELQMLDEQASVRKLSASLFCPKWFSVEMSNEWKTIGGQKYMLRKCTLQCITCIPSYYFASDGQHTVSYDNTSTGVSLLNSAGVPISNNKCLKCPQGADCPGYDLKSKPNNWGVIINEKLLFYQCPIGYCCQGTAANPCDTYNSCSYNREGWLCGKCKPNYALSVMSVECISIENCNDKWVWPLAVSAAVLYMLWYTFKDVVIQNTVVKFLSLIGQHTQLEQEDKGYFGLLAYFVQIEALTKISLNTIYVYKIDTIIQHINVYIRLLLTFQLSTVSNNVCPNKTMTETNKVILRFLFLMAIYASWGVMFSLSVVLKCCVFKHVPGVPANSTQTFLNGLVEIIKYTYGSLSDIMFYSLTCVTLASQVIWYYDGTVTCFSGWQMSMIAFGMFCIVPFPLALFVGLKHIRKHQITATKFLISLFLPMPFLLWVFGQYVTGKWSDKEAAHKRELQPTKHNKELFEKFRGGYRMSDGGTQFWESVIIFRRLSLCSAVLISNSMFRLCVCTFLNSIFLVQHVWVKPFAHNLSNSAEGLSLLMLLLLSIVGVLKSSYIQNGFPTQGENEHFFQNLSLLENMMLPVLISFIVLFEFCSRRKQAKVHP